MTCPACTADAPCDACQARTAQYARELREAIAAFDVCQHVPCIDGSRIVCGRCKADLPG